MPNYGLLLLGIIQIVTAIMIFASVRRPTLAGIATLPYVLSNYRYMLTALWLSVGITFVSGAFHEAIAPGAVLLGVVNVVLEIVGYWTAVLEKLLPRWYAALSTLGMGLGAILAVAIFLARR